MTEGGPIDAFLAHLPAGSSFDRAAAALEGQLRARFEAGRAAWPGVAVSADAFGRHLAQHTAAADLPALDRAADLYIACACAESAPHAAEAFHTAFRADIARAVARVDPSPAFVDDVVQAVSERILIAPAGARARIADYAGRASLRGWLGAVAKRTALNLRRSKSDQAHDPFSSTVEALGADGGPEIALLRTRFKREFEASIRASLASLPAAERSLLLLQLEGVTLPQLAGMHNISRATVARRLAAAREALYERTRRDLIERLRLSPSEFESVAALVRSQLDVGLAGVACEGRKEG